MEKGKCLIQPTLTIYPIPGVGKTEILIKVTQSRSTGSLKDTELITELYNFPLLPHLKTKLLKTYLRVSFTLYVVSGYQKKK